MNPFIAPSQPWPWEVEVAVRRVTAFTSFSDLTETADTYAPVIYTRGFDDIDKAAAQLVVDRFNEWAAENGRARRAEVRA